MRHHLKIVFFEGIALSVILISVLCANALQDDKVNQPLTKCEQKNYQMIQLADKCLVSSSVYLHIMMI